MLILLIILNSSPFTHPLQNGLFRHCGYDICIFVCNYSCDISYANACIFFVHVVHQRWNDVFVGLYILSDQLICSETISLCPGQAFILMHALSSNDGCVLFAIDSIVVLINALNRKYTSCTHNYVVKITFVFQKGACGQTQGPTPTVLRSLTHRTTSLIINIDIKNKKKCQLTILEKYISSMAKA